MTTHREGASAAAAIVTLGAAAAVVYFCFTPAGRRRLTDFERWLETGEQEVARLFSAVERVAALAGIVSGAFREKTSPGDVVAFPAAARERVFVRPRSACD
jgi:hypothetical protein